MIKIISSLAFIFLSSCALNGLDRSRILESANKFDADGNEIQVVRQQLALAPPNSKNLPRGILVSVTNSLAQHEPDVSVEICSDTGKKLQYCLVSETLIPYGQRRDFYVSEDQLNKLLENGTRIEWRFNDSYSNSMIHWSCYEHPSFKPDPHKLNVVDLQVTQINTISYSCKVK